MILVDLICDSDGKIDCFIDLWDVKLYLEVYFLENDGNFYYLGMFLVGVY